MLHLAMLFISIVECSQNEYVAIRGLNKEIKWDNGCASYLDCFNCTLGNCNWSNGVCFQKPNVDPIHDILISTFIKEVSLCTDSIQLCDMQLSNNNSLTVKFKQT